MSDVIEVIGSSDVITIGEGAEQVVVLANETLNVITAVEQGPARDSVNYITVTTATFIVTIEMLIPGINVLGVDYPGAVLITIPKVIPTQMLIHVKDESGMAGINNITIQAEI